MYLQTLTEVSKGSLSIASMKLVIIFDAGMQIATNSLLCINAGFITFSSRKRVVHLVKRKKKQTYTLSMALHCYLPHLTLFTLESHNGEPKLFTLTPYKWHQNYRNLHFHASLSWSSSVAPPSEDGMTVEANPQ